MYYDYHSHTAHSDDCDIPMDAMIEAAIKKGVAEYAITDHFDPDYPDPEFPFEIEFDEYYKDLSEVPQKFADRIKVIKGLEIGIQHGATLEKCKAEPKNFPYDFIIGSFHCFNGDDLYKADYNSMKPEDILPSFYEYCYDCLLDFDDFDVLGHINVIDRYIPFEADYRCYRLGLEPDSDLEFPPEAPPKAMAISYAKSMEIVEAIFKLLIGRGQGIEINTSSFRYQTGDTSPAAEMLHLYCDLGGEVLTIGSDAHFPEHIAYNFDYVVEMAKDFGFRYFTTYSKRQPVMLPLL